jgi:ribonucleoside-diphosphate reductase beta chain
MFFFNLAKNNKLTGVGQEIAYISRDESTHMALFNNIYKEIKKENPDLFTDKFNQELTEMFRTATQHEIDWFTYVCGDNIEGLTIQSIDRYIKYLANQRAKNLDITPLYSEVKNNPFPFIAKMSNPNSVKTDFFENKPINYGKAGKELALDDLDDMEL